MNVIKLKGGIGNQLFQYAFGRAQMQNGIEIKFDSSWYHKGSRVLSLDKFNTVSIEKIKNSTGLERIKDKGFYDGYLTMDGYYFDGYWQYMSYYPDPLMDILRKEITVREDHYTAGYIHWKEKIQNGISTAIHIRRGDYNVKDGFGSLPLKYYYEALEFVEGDLFVFSDELDWCRNRFKQNYFDRKLNFVELRDYHEFELIRLCTNKIISHSTFSLWAALLGNEITQTVVCPVNWINGIRNKPYREKWIKI